MSATSDSEITGRSLDERVFREWWRSLSGGIMRANPLYLASAVLILVGVWFLWRDTAGLSDFEHLQINVLSLQAYELALVVTAILLARRRLWYDATLLYVLEVFFVGVPFLLLSVGSWLDMRAGMATAAIAGGGALLAAGKFAAFRHFFPRLRLSWGLLGFGALVLGLNTTMPLYYKWLHAVLPAEDPTTALRIAAAVRWQWLAGMPLLVWAVNLLPCSPLGRREDRWLPEATALLWVGVTVAHLLVVGYVYDVAELAGALVLPTIWALGWVLYWRSPGWGLEPRSALRRALLVVPLLPGFAAAVPELRPVLWLMMGVNAGLYAWLGWRRRSWYTDSRPELALTVLSVLLAGLALPAPVVPAGLAAADRGEWLRSVLTFLVPAVLLLWHHPLAGLIGAAVLGGDVARLGDCTFGNFLALQGSSFLGIN